jgi:membrane associated rhomboid family serine protease
MGYYRTPPFRPYGAGGFGGVPQVTPANRVLMIACGAVWGVQLLLRLAFGIDLSWALGLVPERVLHGFIWQPFTYMFLHSSYDLFHLLFNLLMMWMIGGELERHWGSRRYAGYFVLCGVGAGIFALVQGLVRGGPPVATVGASGAVYGLILAYGMIFAERVILFMMIFPMRARTLAVVLFAIAFFSNLSRPDGGISHIAHLGGMAVGWIALKRAWRLGDLFREFRWRVRRRRFKVTSPRDDDRWIH